MCAGQLMCPAARHCVHRSDLHVSRAVMTICLQAARYSGPWCLVSQVAAPMMCHWVAYPIPSIQVMYPPGAGWLMDNRGLGLVLGFLGARSLLPLPILLGHEKSWLYMPSLRCAGARHLLPATYSDTTDTICEMQQHNPCFYAGHRTDPALCIGTSCHRLCWCAFWLSVPVYCLKYCLAAAVVCHDCSACWHPVAVY